MHDETWKLLEFQKAQMSTEHCNCMQVLHVGQAKRTARAAKLLPIPDPHPNCSTLCVIACSKANTSVSSHSCMVTRVLEARGHDVS